MAKPFTVYAPSAAPNGSTRVQPSSRDRHAFVQINPDDVADHDGKVDHADLLRLLKLMQDNAIAATEPVRTNPSVHGEMHRQVAMTSGKNVTIKHGLGEPFGGWSCKRAYAGSAAFAAVDAAKNGGLDPKQYLVLAASSTGTYDIEINPR